MALETAPYECPIKEYEAPKKQKYEKQREPWMLEVENGRAFSSSYGVKSVNRKRCLSKE